MQSPSTRYFATLILIMFLSILIQFELTSGVILAEDISLSNADGSFIGENAGDALGTSIAFAGDVNGDGFDDILISSYIFDTAPSGGTDVGKVYLIFGNASSNTNDMDVANAAAFKRLLQVMCVCNNAYLTDDGYAGDATEGALYILDK